MTNQQLNTVIVPAAGVGKRMQADKPKQYLKIGEQTVLEHTLDKLISHPQINRIILVLHPNDPYYPALNYHNANWLKRVDGGKERADSVLAGLRYLTSQVDKPSWVLVHDAARPCFTHGDLDILLSLSSGTIGGLLASPVRDTMKRARDSSSNMVAKTEDRNGLWHALTPQFFPLMPLTESLSRAVAEGVAITDEASAMEWAGHQVKLVEGSDQNIKITRPNDLSLAEHYLSKESKTCA